MSAEIHAKKILSVPVPPAMETFIKERVASQGFHTVSEYVRSLIRATRTKQSGSGWKRSCWKRWNGATTAS